MADTKITALTAISTVDPAIDVLPIVDVSDTTMAASGTTKKITSNQILGAGGTATLASATITGAATVGTTLGVTGVSTLASANVTNNLGVGGAINYTGGGEFYLQNSASSNFVGINAASNYIRFATNNTIKASIDSSGNFNVQSGNVVMATSGKGIDFSATSEGSGTMTSELLNDYEEGTWTPVLGGFGGTSGQTYSLQTGRYTKVGRQVICSFEATLTAVGTVTGNAIISGLPFSSVSTSSQLDGGTTTIGYANNLATNQIFLTGYLNGAGAYSFITGIAAAGTVIDNITATNLFGNTTRLSGTITYTAS